MGEIRRILDEDSYYFDLTTLGLGIGEKQGEMCFYAHFDGVVAGVLVAARILNKCELKCEVLTNDGEKLEHGAPILRAFGSAKNLHKAWKVAQNVLEYTSAIATLTHEMLSRARAINPHIELYTTRKNFPLTKNLALLGAQSGGGGVHRLGLFDSVLVFSQHRAFFESEDELRRGFLRLKSKMLEKKICVEVESLEEARYFAELGADILQCEKMELKELEACVRLKDSYQGILISATGGVGLENIAEIAKSGVSFVVTSAPYHAKPLNVKVKMRQIFEEKR